MARQCARQQVPAIRSSVAAMQQRNSSYSSPFRGTSNHTDTTAIPSFKKYRNAGGETSPKLFQYFMVGTFGAITAMGAKATVQGTPID